MINVKKFRYVVCLICVIYSLNCYGDSKIDSLVYVFNNLDQSASDSLRRDICRRIYKNTKDPEVRLDYANRAYSYSVKCKNNLWKAAAKYYEGDAYMKMGALDKAVAELFLARDLYASVDNKIGVASVLIELAGVHKRNLEFELAESTYWDAITEFTSLKDSAKLAVCYINFGELYRELNKLNSALATLKKAVNISKKINHVSYQAYSEGNIGLVYTDQNKLDSAKLFLNNSVRILEPLGDNYAVSAYIEGLAKVYYKQKNYRVAEEYASKSLKLAQQHGLMEQIRDAYLTLSKINDSAGEYREAFSQHKKYVAYRDSINSEELVRKIANLNSKYKIAQKQKEIDKEKLEKERYLIITIGLISVIGLLLVLGYFILKISRVRKKSNKELAKQHKELELANSTKNKFFSILSHDLRSPLASFHGYSEVIDLCIDHNDLEKLSDISKEMQFSSANMLDLLDNLLQWGVNQMGTQKVVLTVVDLKEIVKTEVNHLMHVSNKKGISITVKIEDSCAIYVDRVRLSIAIRNLINNAIKFTSEGGAVSVVGKRKNNTVKLRIKDNGVGMTLEQKKSLFDFNEITSTYGTKNEKGVGLGMQLVCEFVRSCKATIDVESEVGIGTTFSILFKEQNIR